MESFAIGDMTSVLEQLFQKATGESPVASVEITGSGSARRYCRMVSASGRSLIGTVGTNLDENRAFIYMSGHFRPIWATSRYSMFCQKRDIAH